MFPGGKRNVYRRGYRNHRETKVSKLTCRGRETKGLQAGEHEFVSFRLLPGAAAAPGAVAAAAAGSGRSRSRRAAVALAAVAATARAVAAGRRSRRRNRRRNRRRKKRKKKKRKPKKRKTKKSKNNCRRKTRILQRAPSVWRRRYVAGSGMYTAFSRIGDNRQGVKKEEAAPYCRQE